MNKRKNPWDNARRFKWLSIEIPVLRATKEDPVKYYTEFHVNGGYMASYGSNMPTYTLAALQTYFRGKKEPQVNL